MFLFHCTGCPPKNLVHLALANCFLNHFIVRMAPVPPPPTPYPNPINRKGRYLSTEYMKLIKTCFLLIDSLLSSFVLERKNNAAYNRILGLGRNLEILIVQLWFQVTGAKRKILLISKESGLEPRVLGSHLSVVSDPRYGPPFSLARSLSAIFHPHLWEATSKRATLRGKLHARILFWAFYAMQDCMRLVTRKQESWPLEKFPHLLSIYFSVPNTGPRVKMAFAQQPVAIMGTKHSCLVLLRKKKKLKKRKFW